jgi:CRP-like cAMP-binding protein
VTNDQELDILRQALQSFAGIDSTEFERSRNMWRKKAYEKGEFYNAYKSVCKHLGFVLNGVFRTYYVNDATGEEKNAFFFSRNQVIVAYASFVNQAPCNYYTESLTHSSVFYITYADLTGLYRASHAWEHFGRLVAENAFNMALEKAESLMFKTPEERYLALVKAHPEIFNSVSLYHIASYLGIQGPSLSRIRKRMATRTDSGSHRMSTEGPALEPGSR